ncbi:MAG TPA: peptide chain release factor N(5)-glutamine methyltransferase [Clostridia bacterium]|nr:peptide chain release factor N(5)-glutamine methyltransferase [Clostridia bacterium]
MESIRELLKNAAELLKKSDMTDTPILDAELLLIHVLNKSGMKFDRIKLVTQQQQQLEPGLAARYRELVEERGRGKPVQYITNTQEFMGLELYVEQGVLIPRADTETVVEKVLQLAENIEEPCIIDMCTGSGAIALSLGSGIPGSKVWAVDISDIALKCCRINSARLGLEDRVRAVRSNLFENLREEGLPGKVDIIVSNPPYIKSGAIRELDTNVRDYEPHLALDGGEDGLVYYKSIVRDSAVFLRDGGILAFETGYDQGAEVKEIMEYSGCYGSVKIEKDLAGYDRCVWGYREAVRI